MSAPRAARLLAMDVRLEPWGEDDLPLLQRIVGDPVMMEHLGGAEPPEKVAERQARYVAPGSGSFKVVDAATGDGVGWVGAWARTWRDEPIGEVGWSVLPAAQGRGVATRATAALLDLVRASGKHRVLHAFPSVGNAASNAVCRKAGFTLVGEVIVEYPPGHEVRCNDWRLELGA
jgi:RimJ/RimL family protein N-acetyltransferase